MRVVWRIALLVLLWLLAWGEFSVANLVSGVAAACAVLIAFPPAPRSSHSVLVRSAGVARLIASVVWQLISSNALMTRQILRRTPDAYPGVLAHHLVHPSDEVITVMTSIIALSPGTMTVDVDEASASVYVHFFRLRDIASARASLSRLEALVRAAIVADDPLPSHVSEESP
jgi:multicomponent Na+:H+ antiporter subunit E